MIRQLVYVQPQHLFLATGRRQLPILPYFATTECHTIKNTERLYDLYLETKSAGSFHVATYRSPQNGRGQGPDPAAATSPSTPKDEQTEVRVTQ